MIQGTLEDLGTPLSDVTFVVVDLETTGGSPQECGITEFGAVKVRGGEVLGEFQTFVNPGHPIPAFISVLTGITDSMVRDAPRVEAALTAFLEFAAGSVLVAHNAGFDVSFLKAAARRANLSWPNHPVLDTVHLARQLVTRDEAPNHRLSSLAVLFGATTTPDHRALHDARATVDVLHGLIERVGNLGVHSLEELKDYSARVPAATRRKRHLADSLPDSPGVYVFKDGQGRALYVGTSVNIRTRVRSYFTASEGRRRMAEMVRIAETVTPIVCPTALEAEVRELRLIAAHKPRYNRRSRNPEKALWLKLTIEPFPRLSIVKAVIGDGARYAGPFASRSAAEAAVAAIHEVVPLRQCLERLSPTRPRSACALADMGRCGAPCVGRQTVEEYAVVSAQVADLLTGDSRQVMARLRERMATLSEQERFEDARTVRDRTLSLVRGAARAQRMDPLARTAELVAARRHPSPEAGRSSLSGTVASPGPRSHREEQIRCPTSRRHVPPPRWSWPPMPQRVRPPQRRPTRSCGGSSSPACGSSTSSGSGPVPWGCRGRACRTGSTHSVGRRRHRLRPQRLTSSCRSAHGSQ